MSEENKKENKIPTIHGNFTKTLISVRLSTDLVEIIDENYELITGSSEAVTDRKLFECLVDLALSKAKPNIEIKKQIEQLQDKLNTLSEENHNLNNTISTMKLIHQQEVDELQSTAAESVSAASGNSNAELERHKTIIKSQSDKIDALEEQIRNSADIPSDMMLVNVTENEKKVFDLITAMIKEKTQKDVSPGGMLKSVFFDVVRFGPTTHLMGVNPSWSQIKDILTSSKQPSASGDQNQSQ